MEEPFRTGNFTSEKYTIICEWSILYTTANKLKYIQTNGNSPLLIIMANKSFKVRNFHALANMTKYEKTGFLKEFEVRHSSYKPV